jgi:AraC-like DNA-binding protein
MIKISEVRTDGGTQSRAAINEHTVAEYAEAMADPDTVFPPIIVYYDGRDHWLADGFHRLEAWRRIGRIEVPCETRMGDKRAAQFHACGANHAHGLRPTRDDKRRAVMFLLSDQEWSNWTDRAIAKHCHVSPSTVAKYRQEASGLTVQLDSEKRTYITKHGTEAQMDTSRIGKAEKPAPAPAAQPEPDRSQMGAEPEPAEDYDPVHAERLDAAPDPHAAVRKALRALTREGLEDEVIGLREENAELRKRVKKQTGEIADLKAKVRDLEADEKNEVVRALQQRVKVAGNAQWKAEEDLTAWKRKCFILEKRVKELESMGITL